MSRRAKGNLKGLAPSQLKKLNKLFSRKISRAELAPYELASELYELASELGRRIGLLVSREGKIVEVVVGTREILYLPDLGRYRFGKGRLRRLRLIFSDLSKGQDTAVIPQDIFADLEKLRLDMVVSVKAAKNNIMMSYAHLLPIVSKDAAPVQVEQVHNLALHRLDYASFIIDLENQLDKESLLSIASDKPGAFLVGVYERKFPKEAAVSYLAELEQLAYTAGLEVLGTLMQRRTPDPRTLLGKGKLEDLILQCLRVGAEIIIFDTELKPFQWRVITKSTELKVLDRSMLILDIFAQRARSSDGRLQVELAQLKYNLPRLVEKDDSLSRLTGGIGGRGPGETKLEIGRRRARDRINDLEKRIDKLSQQRELRRSKRKEKKIPLVAILGYTNAGKSTLFNALTSESVMVEDKLFATLDPAQRRLVIPYRTDSDDEIQSSYGFPLVLSDTVGFIRDLPEELKSAFRATLEELYEAAYLIHVLDVSDSTLYEKKASIDEILQQMELTNLPCMVLLNKKDKIAPDKLEVLVRDFDAEAVSALNKEGLEPVLNKLRDDLMAQESPNGKSS